MLFLKHYGVVLKNNNRILFTEGAFRTLYHFKAGIFGNIFVLFVCRTRQNEFNQ